jgi:hypothetical protein
VGIFFFGGGKGGALSPAASVVAHSLWLLAGRGSRSLATAATFARVWSGVGGAGRGGAVHGCLTARRRPPPPPAGVPVEDRIRRAPTLIIVNEQGEEIGSGKGNSHSLWVLSRRLVRMLLKQQGPIALTAAAAVLVGPGGVADPSKHRSQTQVRAAALAWGRVAGPGRVCAPLAVKPPPPSWLPPCPMEPRLALEHPPDAHCCPKRSPSSTWVRTPEETHTSALP